MNILSMENVTKGFTEKMLFEQVSLGIGTTTVLAWWGSMERESPHF